MMPGENVGGVDKTGWCDLRYSIDAFKRSNWEYLVSVEENFFMKVLIYRWCPSGNCSIASAEDGQGLSNDTKIYPNPAKTALYVSGNLIETSTYEILSIEGKILQTGPVNGVKIGIDNLQVGIYIVKIRTKSGHSVQRFVKE